MCRPTDVADEFTRVRRPSPVSQKTPCKLAKEATRARIGWGECDFARARLDFKTHAAMRAREHAHTSGEHALSLALSMAWGCNFACTRSDSLAHRATCACEHPRDARDSRFV